MYKISLHSINMKFIVILLPCLETNVTLPHEYDLKIVNGLEIVKLKIYYYERDIWSVTPADANLLTSGHIPCSPR